MDSTQKQNPKLLAILEKTKKAIRSERIALDLTQKEFAAFLGIKYATYRLFEQEGKIALENFFIILLKLNKAIEYENFLDGFEYQSPKERARNDNPKKDDFKSLPIVTPSQKQIALDKNIFGEELFYSVENGHIYNVSQFIPIVLSDYNDKRIMLLLKYFGIDRLKPYILKEDNIELLQMFNRHIKYMSQRG